MRYPQKVIAVLAMLLFSCSFFQSAFMPTAAPTQTALPAFTPTSASTFTATPNAALIDSYVLQLKPRMTNWIDAYSEFIMLHKLASENRMLILEPKWKSDLKINLNNLSVTSEELSSIRPVPPEFQKANEYFVKISKETDLLVKAYNAIIDGDNTVSQDIATPVNNLTRYTDLALKELEKVMP